MKSACLATALIRCIVFPILLLTSISTLAVPTISAGGPTTFCQGGSVVLTSSPGSSYLWSTGATSQSITVSVAGNYSVTIPGNGTSAAMTITVLQNPIAQIGASGSTTICDGQSVTLSAGAGYITGNAKYYLHSSVSEPWWTNSNIDMMNMTFGTGNWNLVTFDDIIDPNTIFNSGTRFVFLEGSDHGAFDFADFLYFYHSTIENWVNAGGRIFINAAPNEGSNINLYFNGTTLNYAPSTPYRCTTGTAAISHAIFNGPYTPVGTTWISSYFSHAYITGNGLTDLIDGCGTSRLCYKTWGNGLVAFGGLTTANFHSPQPNGNNLRANIFSWVNSSVVSNPALTYLWSTGANTSTISVNTSGTYTATVSTSSGCSGTAGIVVTVNPVQHFSLSYSAGLQFCKGDSIALSCPSASSYHWNTGATTQSIYIKNTGNYFATSHGCSASDTVSAEANFCDFQIAARIFIQGYYRGLGLMQNAIDPNGSPALSDTITMELADINAPHSVLYSSPAILNSDGTCTFHFNTSPVRNSYYVVFKHRNCLESWSANPTSITNSTVSFEPATNASLIYGNNLCNLGDGNFALWSGDLNNDGVIDLIDVHLLESFLSPITIGYTRPDLTGDNCVESADYSVMENNCGENLHVLKP